jgi:hypothetical protein
MRHFYLDKMTRVVYIILVVIVLTSCSQNSADDHDTFPTDTLIAIIPLDTASEYLRGEINGSQSILSLDEFEIIEPIFLDAVKEYNEIGATRLFNSWRQNYDSLEAKLEHFKIDVKNYRRQYVATTNSLGQKEIYINCFRQDEDPGFRHNDWRSSMALAEGGGMNYFHLTINLATRKHTGISVNDFE